MNTLFELFVMMADDFSIRTYMHKKSSVPDLDIFSCGMYSTLEKAEAEFQNAVDAANEGKRERICYYPIGFRIDEIEMDTKPNNGQKNVVCGRYYSHKFELTDMIPHNATEEDKLLLKHFKKGDFVMAITKEGDSFQLQPSLIISAKGDSGLYCCVSKKRHEDNSESVYCDDKLCFDIIHTIVRMPKPLRDELTKAAGNLSDTYY